MRTIIASAIIGLAILIGAVMVAGAINANTATIPQPIEPGYQSNGFGGFEPIPAPTPVCTVHDFVRTCTP